MNETIETEENEPGYACINMELAAKDITTNCGMIEDPASKREAHSNWMPEKINTYGRDADIILETKMKEQSLLKYLETYGHEKSL